MKLKNKFVIGTLIQWYELEMLDEHIHSCIKMLDEIENKKNVTFVFTCSLQEYLEKMDWKSFRKRFRDKDSEFFEFKDDLKKDIRHLFKGKIQQSHLVSKRNDSANVIINFKENFDEFYNIAAFRRDFNWEWQDKADLILWGETDSLWPSQTLKILDQLHESVKLQTPKYIVNFSDRRLWDNSFAPLHPLFEDVPFVEDEGWQFNSPASGKAYMSLEKMNLINDIPFEDIQVVSFNEPRFDGSCVGFSSDLLMSGITLPKSLIHSGEDVSVGRIAKKLLGDEFVQYNISNILHVHNRRHPRKRIGILNEDNPKGFCDNRKGEWWKILEDSSKENLNSLFNQVKVNTVEDVLKKINKNLENEK